jgi:hypothetical protein
MNVLGKEGQQHTHEPADGEQPAKLQGRRARGHMQVK